MGEHDRLAERFEVHRTHLRAVAYRMLGSGSDADDAVQESWLRLSRTDVSEIENLGGWLTTVVSRICLNMLQSRRSRREEPLDAYGAEAPPSMSATAGTDPENAALLADSVGSALLVVLDTLAPAERVAFVLHDMFAVPFDEIAPILERAPAATRQLASRARRRVRETGQGSDGATDLARRREVVAAFLTAARNGDFTALLAVLDPEVVLRADAAAVRAGAAGEVRGATSVADAFSGQARAARPVLVDGAAGAVWAPGGRPRVVITFAITDGRIVAIDLVAEPEHLGRLDLEFPDN
ncbi:sigma-70 family RNA polymerase sigma factor [Plantactinospora solaniradicis]|uniref:Sigma-70 family RNA polymerase sigma factor n=1 Tax=Plantactinospora solaniradicis TaxID=1723736 RepID=A0ABW1KFK6_9ACTN